MDNSTAIEAVHTGMGTEMAHKAFGRHAKTALRAVEKEAQRLECFLSRFLPESDISRINRSAGIKLEKITPETYEILSRAMECSVVSRGLFDITIGSLADLWDYKHASEPPASDKIEKALHLVNYNDLELDAIQKRVGLKNTGQSVDLGGIAKGFRGLDLIEKYPRTEAVLMDTNLWVHATRGLRQSFRTSADIDVNYI